MPSVKDKKEFIRWFTNHFHFKKRACVWILNYLSNNLELLKKIHFVDNIENCPRGMVMTVHGIDGDPFYFHDNGKVVNDAEEGFNQMRVDKESDLYIHLVFPGTQSVEYISVLEDNPFASKKTMFSEEADRIAENSLIDFQRRQLLKEIDRCLDEGDKEGFIELSIKLNELMESIREPIGV